MLVYQRVGIPMDFPGDPIWCVMTSMVFAKVKKQRYSDQVIPHITHTIHVWYIYLHLPQYIYLHLVDVYGKCR